MNKASEMNSSRPPEQVTFRASMHIFNEMWWSWPNSCAVLISECHWEAWTELEKYFNSYRLDRHISGQTIQMADGRTGAWILSSFHGALQLKLYDIFICHIPKMSSDRPRVLCHGKKTKQNSPNHINHSSSAPTYTFTGKQPTEHWPYNQAKKGELSEFLCLGEQMIQVDWC